MENSWKMDVSQPIQVILDGPNYILWAQAMQSFLKGRKLWRYVTGDIPKPVRTTTETDATETDAKFFERLDDWDSKHHQIITWFRNTSVQSINLQFGRFETATSLWDFLATRYTASDLSHQYQLLRTIHQLRQEPGQSIADFHSKMQFIWDQLALSEPTWTDTTDAIKFTTYKDQQHLIQFLMALHDTFEPTRASLLHRHPLPTLEQAVSELISEETRLATFQSQHTDAALVTHSKQSFKQKLFCRYCREPGHSVLHCPTRRCKHCHKLGPGHYIDDCPSNPDKRGVSTKPKGVPLGKFKNSQQFSAATAANTHGTADHDPEPSSFSIHDLESMMHQILSKSGNSSISASSVSAGTHSWYFDSACCNHMTSDPSLFLKKSSNPSLPVIYTADGSSMNVQTVGHISTNNLSLSNAYFIPQLTLNLLSVGQLCDLGLDVLFSSSGCRVQDPQTGKTLGIGRKVGRLFELISLHLPSQDLSPHQSAASVLSSLSLWHSRLGHISFSRLRSLISSGHLGSITDEHFDCISCPLAKQHALPFNNSDSTSHAPFDLIHSDIWGPSPTTTVGGSKYFVIFVDDYSRYTWLYLLHSRSELSKTYFDFANMIKTQFSKTIKIFRTDNAMEYKDASFLNFLHQNGTICHRSCPGTSQQNGRAERKHRHILETVRALLISSACPERFWGEAALTAVYTINRVPSPVIDNQTPYERLYGTPPTYQNLKVFGCSCFVLLQPHEHTKLEPRSCLCCFLGYGIEHKGYRCWDPISNRLRISRHVVFWEHKMFSTMSKFHVSHNASLNFFIDPTIPLFPDDINPDTSHETQTSASDCTLPTPELSEPLADPVPESSHHSVPHVRQSNRVRTPSVKLRDFHCFSTIISLHEPQSYKEASSNPVWQQAMAEELQALDKTHTWDMVDLPSNKTAVGCKWVYKIKTKFDGSVERHKARLVAKGFTQEYGIDYEETFAPVARLTSVRSLLAVAAVRRWNLFQMDVKNAFLNGDLTEEVYMKPPPGYDSPPNKVCRLRRALYGLKQAPRAWFAKFSTTIQQFGFLSSAYDSALFIRKTDHGCIFLLLYVDDMIITGDDVTGISDLKDFLRQHFEMKDLGHLSFFLGLEVSSDSNGFYLSQAKYVSDLLARAGLTDSKTTANPLEANVKLTPLEGIPLRDPTLYRQLVGSLVYLTVTRPDIAYAVHVVSQFMTAPHSTHFAAILHILRYLKGTMFHGLHFSAHSSLDLQAYSDADWAGDPTDRRSTTGFCFFLGDSLISWRSKKQTVTARSSTEAEYRAIADATQELLWLRWLLGDLGVKQSTATPLHCDNRSAIQITHNDVFHERTKHIEIDCHFVRQHVTQGTVKLLSVSSINQPADIFTKALYPGRFRDLISKLKLVSILPS
ncbi:hypothetical protein ACOSP7_018491 [Xanthoceras sorbifolium]